MGQREGPRLDRLTPLPGLPGKRARARAALWWEQLWPAAWPPLGLLGVFLIVALLDLPTLLPAAARPAVPVLFLLGIVALAFTGFRRLNRPDDGTADRRLERVSGLRHRPLATLADRPAVSTPEAAALWEAHRARVAAQLGRLRVGFPRPGLPGRDRRALRGLVLAGLLVALAVAGEQAPGRVARALLPPWLAGPAAPGTLVQAWATPPAYTGLPPVFLSATASAVSVPAGSKLTVSVTGGRGTPSLDLPEGAVELAALDARSWQGEREVGTSGPLTVHRGGGTLAAWTLTVIPDRPPTAEWAEPPGPATANGGRQTGASRFAWRAEDDYGVAGASVSMVLRDRPGAVPLVVPVLVSGSAKAARGTAVRDLQAHPWAGLPVRAQVVAKDAVNQEGRSAELEFTLPERSFTNPAAQAVIAVRKQLSLSPDRRAEARTALDALADRPEMFEGSSTVMLQLRAAGSLLMRGRGQGAVDEAQDRLWQLALALEEGLVDRTARALEAARQDAKDAMEALKQDPADQAKQAELERRMAELRDAIQKHMQALMDQARRDQAEVPFDPDAEHLSPRDLDRMTREAEQAAREGRMDDAQKRMAELERLLEQLQNARPESGEQRQQRNAERRQQGRQQQDAVQDMVRREGELLDRSRGRAEGAPPQPSGPPPGQQAGPQQSPQQNAQQSPSQSSPQLSPQSSPQSRAQDGKRQQAMRRALGELMQRFGDLTGQVPAPLGEADQAMRDAGQALAEGRDAAAGAAQQKAIEALQKGGREMGQQMARQFGRGQQPGEGEEGEGQEGQDGQDGNGDGTGRGPALGNRDGGQSTEPRQGNGTTPRRRSADRDPLGRPLQQGTSGTAESEDVRVPDQMEEARSRALQDELRRRGADRTRPQGELDYIDRLLKSY